MEGGSHEESIDGKWEKVYVELGVQQKDMYALSMNEVTAGAGGIPMGSYTGVDVTKEAQIHCLYARPFSLLHFSAVRPSLEG